MLTPLDGLLMLILRVEGILMLLMMTLERDI
jgi:hypothetical protein